MIHAIKTGKNCVSIDGVEHSPQDAANFAYRITTAVRMAQLVEVVRDELVRAGEKMARDTDTELAETAYGIEVNHERTVSSS
jgi:hypothetical protein